jgi:hypothetical protein
MKKKKEHDEDELLEIDEESDHPVHETYVKEKKIKTEGCQ